MGRYERERNFLKSNFDQFKSVKTDKMEGVPQPPTVRSYNLDSDIISLPKVSEDVLKKQNIYQCINERRSISNICMEHHTIQV